MSILDRRHVREETLAAVGSEEQAPADLSPSDRQHLEMCDRCSGLIEGHRLATRALSAPWQFVTAGEVSTGRGIEPVRGMVSGGIAGSGRISPPIAAMLALLLLSVLIGTAFMVGASRQAPPPLSGVTTAASASPSPAPTLMATPTARPTPIPTPIDTSAWVGFDSPHYGFRVSRPPGWQVTPAIIRWDLIVDQQYQLFMASTDRLTSSDPVSTFAGYGMTIPDGIPPDGFVEAYRAPNVARGGLACFPPQASWERVPIDGHVAGLATGCGYLEAIVVVGRRIYIFSGYNALSTDRHLFDALLSTIRLRPETADDAPFPASPTPK